MDLKEGFDDTFNEIFSQSYLIYLLWFLAIYLVIYFILAIFFTSSSPDATQLRISRVVDLVFFSVFFLYLIAVTNVFQTSSSAQTSNWWSTITGDIESYVTNPYSIFGLILFIIAFYLMIFLIGIPMTRGTKPFSISIIENVSWIIFVILLIYDFFHLVLKIDLMDYLFPPSISKLATNPVTDSSGNNPKNSSSPQNSSSPKKPDQVFNVSNNLYTYSDAKDVCSSLGAKLATYDQIEKAYNDGAEWCNYGWSDNQMAFFPTQKSTWNLLQTSDKTKNNCGRPGINGGYMANPYMKFGVNCYGQKPDPTPEETALMQSNVPTTATDTVLDEKVKFWKKNRDKLLVINSFNHNKWSEY
jgi:hypothetical protein